MGDFILINKFIFSLLEGLIILVIFSLLAYDKRFIRYNKLKTFFFIIFYTLFSVLAILSLPTVWHTVAIISFTIVILTFFTSTVFWVSLIYTLISAIYIFITEFCILLISSAIIGINIYDILNDTYLLFQIGLVVKSFQLGLLVLLYKIKLPFIKKFSYEYENYIIEEIA